MPDLVDQMLSGDRLALSRLISMVEGRSKDLVSIMSRVHARLNRFDRCGKCYRIGVTGPPGAGKSTLVDRLITHLRRNEKTIGVIAIDPSSPFSGGAVLGDRIRMQDHAGDEGVFIRSLGSRGSHGGVSRATREVAKLYDAFGMDFVIVETVGVGQTELDIMEIADIFVVNKADRDGADLMQAELKAMLEMGGRKDSWKTPVLPVQAHKGLGVAELVQSLEDHRAFRRYKGKGCDRERKKRIALEEAKEIIFEELQSRISKKLGGKRIPKIENPYEFARDYLRKIDKS